jgi:sugar-specific transcriptional regulator TrmB
MTMLEHTLYHAGLTPVEAKVYLTCLKLGTQEVAVIAKESKLSRTDAINVLAALSSKGFVSKFSHMKDFFTPEHPRIIHRILETEHTKKHEGLQALQQILPQLEEYMRPGFTKPEIAFYEGKHGVIAAYEDTLTAKKNILAIASIDDTESELGDYMHTYYLRRKAAGIPIKAIFPDSPMSRSRQKKDEKELRESRLLPASMLDMHIELNIYEDKVAYFSIREKLAIVVKSKMIADSMRQIFKLCWKMAEFQQSIKK